MAQDTYLTSLVDHCRDSFLVFVALVAVLGGCGRPSLPPTSQPPARVAFHLVVRSDEIPSAELEAMKRHLPENDAKLPVRADVQWFPIHDRDLWAHRWLSGQQQPIEDFAAYFNNLGLVAVEADGRWWLLLQTDDQSSLVSSSTPGWSVLKAYPTQDNLGNFIVGFELDQAGSSALAELTSKAIGQDLAVLVDGEIYCALKIAGTVSRRAVILGNFDGPEIDRLIDRLNPRGRGGQMISDPYLFMCLIATALGILFGLTRHRFFRAVRFLTYTLLVNSLVWLVAAAKDPLFASAADATGAVIAWIFFLMVNIEFAALPFLLCRGARWLLSRRQDHLTNRSSCRAR